MTDDDIIMLAEAMGWQKIRHMNERLVGYPPGQFKHGGICSIPDPRTDANDDYAVLEWMRGNNDCTTKAGGYWMTAHIGNEKSIYSCDYQLGDYARAAIAVLKGRSGD